MSPLSQFEGLLLVNLSDPVASLVLNRPGLVTSPAQELFVEGLRPTFIRESNQLRRVSWNKFENN